MSPTTIFQIEATVMAILCILIAKWYVWPRIKNLSIFEALTPLLLISAIRVMAISLYNPAVTGNVPETAFFISKGDLAAAILALIALFFVRTRNKLGLPLTWLYSIVSTIDILGAIWKIQAYDLPAYFGPFGLIVVFVVPPVIIASGLIWMLLFRNMKGTQPA